MSTVEPKPLVNSVMAKLYDVLTNGDETVPQSEDNFFTWCTPGIPVEVEDFDFLSQGLTGVVKKKAIDEIVTAGGGATRRPRRAVLGARSSSRQRSSTSCGPRTRRGCTCRPRTLRGWSISCRT